MTTVLAIDPGRQKCGFAIVSSSGVVKQDVIARSEIVRAVAESAMEFPVTQIIIGNGTGGEALASEVRSLGLNPAVDLVPEAFTTLRARDRFFKENPPRGFRRLIPQGLLVPSRPYDDYVAIILAEEYLDNIVG